MNATEIIRRLDQYRPFITFLQSYQAEGVDEGGIPFLMSEIGNSLNAKHTYS